jgi:hypothetical protein
MIEGERVVFEVIKDPEHPPHGRHLLIGEYPVAGPGGVETSYITRAVWITLGRIYFWSDHGGDPVEGVDWSKCKLVRDEPIPDPVPALEAEIERLKGLFGPGVAPAIVQGMHDWAEKYGHGGHMSWSPMRTVDDHVAKLEARIAELEGELSRLKVFAGRVARSGHSSFCSCYECETVRVMCPAEGQYDRQGKWQWKPPTPAAAKEQ